MASVNPYHTTALPDRLIPYNPSNPSHTVQAADKRDTEQTVYHTRNTWEKIASLPGHSTPGLTMWTTTEPKAKHALTTIKALLSNASPSSKDVNDIIASLSSLSELDLRVVATGLNQSETQRFLAHLPARLNSDQKTSIDRFRNERVLATLNQMIGKFFWELQRGFVRRLDGTIKGLVEIDRDTGKQNDFAVWINKGQLPTVGSKMNCFQILLFAAYQAGVMSEQEIRDIFSTALNAASGKESLEKAHEAFVKSLTAQFGLAQAAPLSTTRVPKRGDWIFCDGLEHVMISLGGDDVMSLDDYRLSTPHKLEQRKIRDIIQNWNISGKNPKSPLLQYSSPLWNK